jgi:hypothetical protein
MGPGSPETTVVILSLVHSPHWEVAVVDRVMTAWLLTPTRSEEVEVAEVAEHKITPTSLAWRKVGPLFNRPLLRVDTEMRVAGVSTGTLVCPITAVVAVVELVGRAGP